MTDTGNTVNSEMDAEVKVRFTKITNLKGKLCKVCRLESGRFEKGAEPKLNSGKFETVDLPWSTFGNYINNLNTTEAITASVCNKLNGDGGSIREGFIVSGSAFKAGKKLSKTKETVARTTEFFKSHTPDCPVGTEYNLLYLDIDDMSVFESELDLDFKSTPEGVAWGDHVEDCLEKLILKVLQDLPELKNLKSGFWMFPSAGALIFDDEGNCLSGLSGVHTYFLLPVECEIRAFRDYIHATLWCKGYGKFKFSANASELSRTYIDGSTLSRNRLDFISGAHCLGRINQDRGEPLYISNDLLGTPTDNLDLAYDSAEVTACENRIRNTREYQEAKRKAKDGAVDRIAQEYKVNRKNAEEILLKLQHNILPGSATITFDDGSEAKVWKILLNPDKYHLKTTYDPHRLDKGSNKAQIYYNKWAWKDDEWEDDGHGNFANKTATERKKAGTIGGLELTGDYESCVVMHSFVSGGTTFRFEFDYSSVAEIIETKTEDELMSDVGENWLSILSSHSLSKQDRANAFEKLKLVRKLRGQEAKLTDIKQLFDAHCDSNTEAETQRILKEINEQYFLLFEGGKARVVYEEMSPWMNTLRLELKHINPNQFEMRCNKWKAFKWVNGVNKPVDIANLWLKKWEDRRTFEGMAFAPQKNTKEIIINQNGREIKYYNLFQGYSEERVEVSNRRCEGKHCGGQGCINWFFSTGYKQCNWKEVTDKLTAPGLKEFEYKGKGSDTSGVVTREAYDDWGCGYKYERGGGEDYGFEGYGVLWWLRSTYENLCKGDIEMCRWLTGWAADLLQNPGKRPGTALVSRGGQGVGKGLFINAVSELISKHFIHTSNMRDVSGNFNAHLQSTLLVFADEAVFGGSVEMANTLKRIVTEDTLNIEKKGVDKIVTENHIRLYVSSNNAWVVSAEEDERRYCVVNCWEGHKQDREFFRRVWAVKYDKGVLLDELLAFDLKDKEWGINISKAPDSEGLQDQKDQNLSLEDEFVQVLVQGLVNSGFEGDSEWAEIGNQLKKRVDAGCPMRSRMLFEMALDLFKSNSQRQFMKQRQFTTRLKSKFSKGIRYVRSVRSRFDDENGVGFVVGNLGEMKNKYLK